MHYLELISLLKTEVKPALGCTEPAAVALAATTAAATLGGRIDKVTLTVSANIFKNALAVTIPNTNEAGVALAGALGVLICNPIRQLELFSSVTSEMLDTAHRLLEQGAVQVCIASENDFYILAQVEGENGRADACLANGHTNLVYARVNGRMTYQQEPLASTADQAGVAVDLKQYTIDELVKAVEMMPAVDIAFLHDGLTMNLDIAVQGLELVPGLGVGGGLKVMLDKGIIADDVVNRAKIAVGAACDARMAGLDFPVMSTMGSGNQGIVAIVPIAIVARKLVAMQEQVDRALALSHLITAYVKQYIGKLSPICGCAVAAGTGAAGAITWLLGGNTQQISGAIKNIISNLAGMICDGAKGGCALKLATSAGEAIIAAQLAMQNIIVSPRDGIVAATAEQTIRHLAELNLPGTTSADQRILTIMLNKEQRAAG